MDRRRKAQQRKGEARTSAETEKTCDAENSNGMAPNRYDRTRNGKAKIPRRTESGRKEDNMAKFKVGDRIELISNIYSHACIGDKGKVVSANYNIVGDTCYGVQMDVKRPFYHSCHGKAVDGYGQYLWGSCLKLVEEKPTREFKLIITSKGDTTTAKLIHGERTVVKEATVTRYSKDEYSEKAAVEAVTKKIFGEDEKKEELFNGKVVCLMDLTYIPKYTKGRVYEFVNGNCKDDYGNVINFRYTLEEVEKSKWFLPIVE